MTMAAAPVVTVTADAAVPRLAICGSPADDTCRICGRCKPAAGPFGPGRGTTAASGRAGVPGRAEVASAHRARPRCVAPPD